MHCIVLHNVRMHVMRLIHACFIDKFVFSCFFFRSEVNEIYFLQWHFQWKIYELLRRVFVAFAVEFISGKSTEIRIK